MTKAERETYKAEFVTGNYRTLKEFAKAKGIAYSEVQKVSAQDKWMFAKRKNAEEIGKKTVEQNQQKRVQTAQGRIDETLEISSKLRNVADRLISKPDITAKEVNALASALYRIKEVEAALLNFGQDDSNTDKVIVNINVEDCEGDSDE